jgi:micrococcal nuclease
VKRVPATGAKRVPATGAAAARACRRWARRVAVTSLLLLPALPACNPDDPCGPASAVVASVVDGDTIVLEGGTKVRYLDVDTPESTNEIECYGEEAAAYNESRVLGRVVRLTYEAQCTDRYGRLLAHVWLDGEAVGLDLVTNGYGCALIIAPDDEQRARFEDAENVARAYGRGLWSACGDPPPR